MYITQSEVRDLVQNAMVTRVGMLTVYETVYGDMLFEYLGNMGADYERDVRPLIVKAVGEEACNRMEKEGLHLDDGRNIHDDVSYSWVIALKNS